MCNGPVKGSCGDSGETASILRGSCGRCRGGEISLGEPDGEKRVDSADWATGGVLMRRRDGGRWLLGW